MDNKFSVIDKIKQKYINDNLESAGKIGYTELGVADGATTVLYKDLENTVVDGYPIASDFVDPSGKVYSVTEFAALDSKAKKKCELRYTYMPFSHELYVGTTGSGKTTGCVEPQLRAISKQKNKPNLFLTDPKGEIFDHNAQHLVDQGYNIHVLNFKDLLHSDKWNPLLELYETKMRLKDIGNGCVMRTGKVKKGLTLMGKPEEFSQNGYVVYDGKAFPNGETCDRYIAFMRDYLEADIENKLNSLTHLVIKVTSRNDPTWEMGAQDLFKGLLMCMLEDAVDENSGFTRDMMTFRTVQQYYLSLRNYVISRENSLRDHPLVKKKSERAISLMTTALQNAPNTMKSYCGVFDTTTKDWFQGHIFALTGENTIKLDYDKPTAIFLITRDYDKSDFLIAGMFIDWVYRNMLHRAEETESPRATHFILDEFGNIPEIKDFENKIATSRSRNIWFHIIVQSYMQIDLVYGADRAAVIRDNCNAQIFLGSQNLQSKRIFSEECGRHYIATLNSKLDPSDNTIVEVPLVPLSDLDLIKPGQIYMKRLYLPVILSQFIRSYICAEQGAYENFTNAKGLLSCTPLAIESFTSERFTYAALKKRRY